MPNELQEWLPRSEILTYDEITRLVRVASELGVSKVRVTGGEPLTRKNIVELFRQLSQIREIEDIGVSTNGSLLAKTLDTGHTLAEELVEMRVRSVNISLDTLSREKYHFITGRDLLESTLLGIEAAKSAGFEKIKLNTVLMRDRNQDDIPGLVYFAREHQLLLRFIELMPVSSSDVLSDERFLPIAVARRRIEEAIGPLTPEPEFRTNGPAVYYRLMNFPQRIGFIGAMTDLHFCESCNKLRLTCDGKLRPCLGSHLEFDIKTPMREGATDDDLRYFFLQVVQRKPKEHDFRANYQPGRKMVAIGG